MARARAAVLLAVAVCCLLVATAPARRPVDLPAARATDAVVLVEREAAAEPLLRPMGAAADCAEAADEQGTALAVPEQEDASRVEATTTSGGASALEVRASSEETTTTVEGWRWGWPAVSGKAAGDDERRPYDSDSDSDWDSDSDDEDEGGFFRWLWRLADHFF